ncbi:hypothetical protein QC763_0090440 [Podospora pseudopauciseta]|uniref:Uncharacterized protein n=1 Tax=Podospora pseudopauciseta TaxID=2093780 RepID=A0ABR0H436_9PEZI|nr:hypothetical protein QC763_0090440 [Podospora pseudopauciseta]
MRFQSRGTLTTKRLHLLRGHHGMPTRCWDGTSRPTVALGLDCPPRSLRVATRQRVHVFDDDNGEIGFEFYGFGRRSGEKGKRFTDI